MAYFIHPTRFRRRGGSTFSRRAAAAACAVVFPIGARGQLFSRSEVIENARIVTLTERGTIEKGGLILKGDRVSEVGPDVKRGLFGKSYDASGKTVTPGLIDVYGGLAMTLEGGVKGSPTCKAFDAWDRYASGAVKDALRHGVTTVYVGADGSMGINGTGAIVALSMEKTGQVGTLLKDDAALHVNLGSRENPIARLQAFNAIRRQFRDAAKYRRDRETYEEDLKEYEEKLKERAEKKAKEEKEKTKKETPKEGADSKEKSDPAEKPDAKNAPAQPGEKKEEEAKKEEELKKPAEPAPDRDKELLLKVLDREMPIRVEAQTSEDIFNALDLAREFNLDLLLEGAAEAHLVADALEEADVKVILGSITGSGLVASDGYPRLAETNGPALSRAGVEWFVGGGSSHQSLTRFVLMNAQLAAGYGAGDLHPLEMVTRQAARLLGLERTGYLAPGARADLVIWSGDPLDPASRVERVYVGGKPVFDRASEDVDD